MRGWLRASDFAVSTTRRSESSSVLLVVARAVRPSSTVRTETARDLLGDVLVNRVVGEARERVGDHADFDFGFVRVAELENSFRDAPHSASESRCRPATAGPLRAFWDRAISSSNFVKVLS